MPRHFAAVFFAAGLAHAAVTRVEITQRSDVPVVDYQQIAGKIYFAIDPKLPANRIITDIDLAPRNSKGLVEFSADLYVLKPKNPAKSNGTALFEVSNRGGKGMLNMFDLAPGRVLRSAQDFGDPLLFEAGYTLVWVGWEFDVPDRAELLKLYAPVIRGSTGPVRSEITLDRRQTSASLGDRAQIPYAVADQASATLTVRDRVNSARTTIPRDQWKFNADATGVEYPAGFDPGRIYEVVYTGKDPAVVGPGAGGDSRLHLLHQAAGRSETRHRVRRFAERAFSAHLSLLRLQYG